MTAGGAEFRRKKTTLSRCYGVLEDWLSRLIGALNFALVTAGWEVVFLPILRIRLDAGHHSC